MAKFPGLLVGDPVLLSADLVWRQETQVFQGQAWGFLGAAGV